MSRLSDPNLINKLSKYKNWFYIIGIVFVILGFLALSNQFFATKITVYFFGIILIIAGVSQGIHSLKIKGFGQSLLWAVLAVIYVLAGIISFRDPFATSGILTLMIGILLVMSGVIQSFNSLANRNFPRWQWVLFSGIISVILGVMILASWPVSGLWVLGMFLGIDLLFQGFNAIFIGSFLSKSGN